MDEPSSYRHRPMTYAIEHSYNTMSDQYFYAFYPALPSQNARAMKPAVH
ncbi:hypothetical protein ACN08Z_05840 [Rothia sp. P7181]